MGAARDANRNSASWRTEPPRMADESTPKRRRVTQACESCRSLKAKCDGKRPICDRCQGYGYTCRWKDSSVRLSKPAPEALASSKCNPDSDELTALRYVNHAFHQILSRVRDTLDPEDQYTIDSISVNTGLAADHLSVTSPSGVLRRAELLQPFRSPSVSVHRYLGEVSDVYFFNSVKSLIQSNSIGRHEALPLESYEREAAEVSHSPEDARLELPDRDAADKFVDIYFSTIHVAYPFIDRQQFMGDYEKVWDQQTQPDQTAMFNALLLTIFAVGSYYNICTLLTEQSGPVLHSVYFQRAVLVACYAETESSTESVCVLLAQCFYLLATCQTDRCWMTLGLAIRKAQSIGLHVEEEQPQSQTRIGQTALEIRRRTWYSLYVLDRLLSLQLGRPSAIRNRDCNVKLPSRLVDAEFTLIEEKTPQRGETEPKLGDYFIAVIGFSTILGHVIRDVYRPSMMDYSKDMLCRTDQLDAELLNWRSQLPRWLRFDRGHTFESSAVLKRQRNMLAIKFHHLRALIHRPYLCLPWLQRNDNNIKSLLESNSHRVVYFERICVREAQETAHMLHDVIDKKTLVEDFPWWQMISCLICASSILLVMRAFTPSCTAEEEIQREMLEEDADTCLKVFDALSTNSEGARLARDMLQNLRESRVQDQSSILNGTAKVPARSSREETHEAVWSPQVGRPSTNGPGSAPMQDLESDDEAIDQSFQTGIAPILNWQDWPSEIADSMAWSSQFVDTLDPADLDPSYA